MIQGALAAPFHQHLGHHLFKTGGQVGERQGVRLLFQLAHLAQHRRFQTAEAEVIGMETPFGSGDPTFGQAEPGGISRQGRRLNRRTAGIAEAQQPRHLVEAFTGGVIATATQPAVTTGSLDPHQFGVAATDQQHQMGPGRGGLQQLGRTQMPFQVMHTHKGLVIKAGQGAGRHRTHQKGPHQTRGHAGGDAIHVGQR